jgi:hypothetical protein
LCDGEPFFKKKKKKKKKNQNIVAKKNQNIKRQVHLQLNEAFNPFDYMINKAEN